jgi:hypothetical protein
MNKQAIKGIHSDLLLQALAEEDSEIHLEMLEILERLDSLLIMDKPPLEKITDEILGNLDFQRIREAMLNKGWIWARSNPPATPTVAEMQEEVKRQIQDVWNNRQGYHISCGGFTTTKYYNNLDNTASIKVSFELDSYETGEVTYDR